MHTKQSASLDTFSRYLLIPWKHFSYNRWLDYHEPRVSQNSLTSFPKTLPTKGSRKTLRFSTLRSLHLVGKMDFLSIATQFSKAKQYTTQRHTAVKTGLPFTRLLPFSTWTSELCYALPIPRGRVQSCHCVRSMQSGQERRVQVCHHFLNSTTLPFFTLASASQMQSTIRTSQALGDRKVSR